MDETKGLWLLHFRAVHAIVLHKDGSVLDRKYQKRQNLTFSAAYSEGLSVWFVP